MPSRLITVYNEDVADGSRVTEVWTAYDENAPDAFETAPTPDAAVRALCARLGVTQEGADVRTQKHTRLTHAGRPYRRKWYLLAGRAGYWAGDGRWLPFGPDMARYESREAAHTALADLPRPRSAAVEVRYEPLDR